MVLMDFPKPAQRRCFIFLSVLLENIGVRKSEASTWARASAEREEEK